MPLTIHTQFVRNALTTTTWEKRPYVDDLITLERLAYKVDLKGRSIGWAGIILYTNLQRKYPAECVAIRRELAGHGPLSESAIENLKARLSDAEKATSQISRLRGVVRDTEHYRAWLLAGGRA